MSESEFHELHELLVGSDGAGGIGADGKLEGQRVAEG